MINVWELPIRMSNINLNVFPQQGFEKKHILIFCVHRLHISHRNEIQVIKAKIF